MIPRSRRRRAAFWLLAAMLTTSLIVSGCSPTPQEGETAGFDGPDDDLDLSNLDVSALEEAFMIDDSLVRVGQIREALDSFKDLTEKGKVTFSQDLLDQVGNTDWETQALGFYNWTNAVEGALKKQDYQIKKLEFELAIANHQDGLVSEADLELKRAAYEKAKIDFQQFLDGFVTAD